MIQMRYYKALRKCLMRNGDDFGFRLHDLCNEAHVNYDNVIKQIQQLPSNPFKMFLPQKDCVYYYSNARIRFAVADMMRNINDYWVDASSITSATFALTDALSNMFNGNECLQKIIPLLGECEAVISEAMQDYANKSCIRRFCERVFRK